MRYRNLKNADLNLLAALPVLVEERNITRAARRMFVSQPAMSRIVDRLQTMFDDELLVRTTDGYEPTQRAISVCAELRELLPRLEGLFQPSDFDPSKATGMFRIETTDWGATVLIPQLIAIVAKQAPDIEIDVIPRRSGFERLAVYEADLLLTPLDAPISDTEGSAFRAAPLLPEKRVCIMRAGHPLANRRLTLKRYLGARHVSLEPMQDAKGHSAGYPEIARATTLEQSLRSLGGQRDIRARIPYFASLGPIVEHTDLIATAPLQVARRLKTPRTRIVPAPKEIPGFVLYQVWHLRNDSVPLHRWLRETLRSVAARLSR